jgi:hypothetical protein
VFSLVPLQVSFLGTCQLYMSISALVACIRTICISGYSSNDTESDHATSVPGGSAGKISCVCLGAATSIFPGRMPALFVDWVH